ncbi:MAG: choice-of-anchor X domain-containing protein [candidate division Zixibacteria bacterium]
MRIKVILSIILSILVLINISCDGDNGTEPQAPGLSDIILESYHHFADSIVVSILATDPQGIDDIDSVRGRYSYLGDDIFSDYVFFKDDGLDPDTIAGDGRYSVKFLPADGEFEFGFYLFSAQAIDKGGNVSMPLDTLFWTVDGDKPILFNPIGPDSLEKGSPDIYYIFINAYDPGGLADIDSVYFIATRPDGSSNGIHQYMYDDGSTYEDSVAEDGRYTIGIQAPDTTSQSGDFVFTFYALDKDRNPSNNPEIVVTAY